MDTTKNIFKLRFFGDEENKITPESFTIKEVAQLFIKYHDAISSIIESKFPEIEVDALKLSCIGIENKSESITITTLDSPQQVNEACVLFGKSIADNSYIDLPTKHNDCVRYIYEKVREKNCNGFQYKHDESEVFTLKSKNFKLIKPETVMIHNETIIYGQLVKIGGDKKPKAWLEFQDGKKVDFVIDIDKAKKLSPKLYSTVALKGVATVNVQTKNTTNFKLYDIVDYKPGHLSAAFSKLKDLTSGAWDNYKTDEDINKALGRI